MCSVTKALFPTLRPVRSLGQLMFAPRTPIKRIRYGWLGLSRILCIHDHMGTFISALSSSTCTSPRKRAIRTLAKTTPRSSLLLGLKFCWSELPGYPCDKGCVLLLQAAVEPAINAKEASVYANCWLLSELNGKGSRFPCEVEQTFGGRPMPAMPAQEARN